MKKPFTASEISLIEYLSEPAASPDGKEFAYVKTIANESKGDFIPSVILIERNTGTQSSLSIHGGQKSPSWSPDGKYFAMLCSVSGEYQIWIQNCTDRIMQQLTSMRHGVERYIWSPDGSSIAFQARLWKKEIENGTAFFEMDSGEKKVLLKEKAGTPLEITEIIYKYDGEGLLDGSIPCIGTIRIDDKKLYMLPADFPCLMPAWSPCGEMLAFYGRPYGGVKARRNELFVCRRHGGGLKQLTEGIAVTADNPPCYTADGKNVIFDPWPELPKEGGVQSLFSVPVEGGSPTELFNRESDTCYGIDGMPSNRTIFGEENPKFRLSCDGDYVYFLSAWHGAAGVFRLGIKNRNVEPVIYGKHTVQSFCLTKNDEVLYTLGKPDIIAELYIGDKRLTYSNAWMNEYEIAPVENLSITARDGKTQIEGWVMHPSNRETGKKYPAVLYIRGGPETTSTEDFWHEYQALAGSGIVVLYCNPRGGSGYGPKFNENGTAWSAAAEDLMDFVDAVVKLGFIDEKRIGVTGGSYGGYMTNKLIGTTKKFAAAVIQRTLCNNCTSYGTGDMGFASAKVPVPDDFRMLDFLTDRARKSNIRFIDDIKTPLLILHGYKDYRCSFEQAEQLFVAMKERNPEVPVRLVMFPNENHNITRTGNLHNQIRHLHEMVGWFRKYIIETPREGGKKNE